MLPFNIIKDLLIQCLIAAGVILLALDINIKRRRHRTAGLSGDENYGAYNNRGVEHILARSYQTVHDREQEKTPYYGNKAADAPRQIFHPANVMRCLFDCSWDYSVHNMVKS